MDDAINLKKDWSLSMDGNFSMIYRKITAKDRPMMGNILVFIRKLPKDCNPQSFGNYRYSGFLIREIGIKIYQFYKLLYSIHHILLSQFFHTLRTECLHAKRSHRRTVYDRTFHIGKTGIVCSR